MKNEQAGQSRRDFLKLATTAAPAAVVAVTAGTESAEAAELATGSGLRKTEHVKTYLQTARF